MKRINFGKIVFYLSILLLVILLVLVALPCKEAKKAKGAKNCNPSDLRTFDYENENDKHKIDTYLNHFQNLSNTGVQKLVIIGSFFGLIIELLIIAFTEKKYKLRIFLSIILIVGAVFFLKCVAPHEDHPINELILSVAHPRFWEDRHYVDALTKAKFFSDEYFLKICFHDTQPVEMEAVRK